MKAYLALIRVNLRLALRERIAIFFNYIFPLIFFFAFGELLHAERGGAIMQIVTMVLVIGVLGNGLFGGGIRAVQDREQNILRRFKVAPISPAPILVASMVTGWALYIPAVVMTLVLAHFVYGMPVPERWFALLVLVSFGVIAFRAIGLIIASVANSAQESQILVQLVYLPMLFLTGTTFSIAILPDWAQTLAHFLPATYLVAGIQGTLVENQPLTANWNALAILALTTLLAAFFAFQLFRWEKDEKLRASAKLSLIGMILPSLVFGGWQAYTRDHSAKAKILYREMQRGRTLLIRGARIFTGDGRTIESGGVLVRGGKIAAVFAGSVPAAADLKADPIEAAGKTILPGLIDLDVNVSASGLRSVKPDPRRTLAAYLYCGITAVRAANADRAALALSRKSATGEQLEADLFTAVPGILPAANPAEVAARLDSHPAAIEYSGFGKQLSSGLLDRMARDRVAYIPMLSVADSLRQLSSGSPSLLSDSLVQQVAPPQLLASLRSWTNSPEAATLRLQVNSAAMGDGFAGLRAAFQAHVPLAAGSGAGSLLVLHGPTVQRELELWVRAGVPAASALEAATGVSARLLGASQRIGTIAEGLEANLLIVDGNPLEDISTLERISDVVFRGERIDRSELFQQ